MSAEGAEDDAGGTQTIPHGSFFLPLQEGLVFKNFSFYAILSAENHDWPGDMGGCFYVDRPLCIECQAVPVMPRKAGHCPTGSLGGSGSRGGAGWAGAPGSPRDLRSAVLPQYWSLLSHRVEIMGACPMCFSATHPVQLKSTCVNTSCS